VLSSGLESHSNVGLEATLSPLHLHGKDLQSFSANHNMHSPHGPRGNVAPFRDEKPLPTVLESLGKTLWRIKGHLHGIFYLNGEYLQLLSTNRNTHSPLGPRGIHAPFRDEKPVRPGAVVILYSKT
jgi:hypothetical protein